jgi:fructose-bisphosphate aldolase class II
MMHLDHGKSLAMAEKCMDAGYGSIMIDASKETLENNIAITQAVVTEAHARGVWVEAELGAILGDEGVRKLQGELTPEDMLTDPKQVVRFVRETGVDALAISVGTIHGAFTGQEYIRFELIEKIEKIAPNLPLVVHGASGIIDDHIRKISRFNVCKVNVDTEVRIAFLEAVKSYFGNAHEKVDVRDIMRPAQQAMQQVVEKKIEWLGSGGRADV